MDPQTKGQLAASIVKLCMPLASAGSKYYFERKAIERQKEHTVEVAEHREKKLRELTGAMASEPATPEDMEIPPATETKRLYRQIARLQHQTKCGFCQEVLSMLMRQDPETARQGFAEISQLEREKRRMRQEGASKDEIEAKMSRMVDSWEVVPTLIAGGG